MSEFYEGRLHGFDEFFGNLYHLNAEEEPELPDYPKDPAFREKFGPRVASATAIGVGGMMGAGLYTLVGLAGVWVPLAFLVGGAVSVFSVYSYAKLGARYPSRGGAAQFLIRCFGDGVIAGGLNVFQFLGWIIAMALYCAGFAGYVRARCCRGRHPTGRRRHRHRVDRRRRDRQQSGIWSDMSRALSFRG